MVTGLCTMRRIKPQPNQTFKRKSAMVDLEVWQQVKEYYEKRGVSMSEVVRVWAETELRVISDERFLK